MWKWLLPALCAVVTIAMVATLLDEFGFGSKPWLGYWDAVPVPAGRPFVMKITQIEKGGAADWSGFREGDQIDLRRVNRAERAAPLTQPATTQPLTYTVIRDGRTLRIRFTPSSPYEGNGPLKVATNVLSVLAYLWALACAWVVAVRRAGSRAGAYLCLALLAVAAQGLSPYETSWPNEFVTCAQIFFAGLLNAAVAALPIGLARSFGARSKLRSIVEGIAIAAVIAVLTVNTCAAIGVWNASIDPLPLLFVQLDLLMLPYGLSLTCVAIAVALTARSERARAAWLLLPLPIAIFVSQILVWLLGFTTSWETYMLLSALANAALLLGAAAVTYALLKRRVLDFQFVVSRALVLAGVSTIVVAAFVLLEWLLGGELASASHATGVAANAALALVLGLSMRAIHSRVDRFVDFTFFHERRENEQALREFAREASFVTNRDVLLDQMIDQMRRHTDATAAAVFLDGAGMFDAVRWYGEQPHSADENDELVLALKARHAPADPHRYATTLKGDVALPMLARGRLVGVLVCGHKHSGEAFAPDEVEAMAEFAHGAGSALESLERAEKLKHRDDAIISELSSIRGLLERLTSYGANRA